MTHPKLHPDRALPADPATRAAAREIHAATRDLPLLCLHGHVEASLLADDAPFGDPAELFVTPDHYLTRMLVSQGVAMEALGIAGRDPAALPAETDPRAIWRTFCEHWHLFRGTPTRFWLEYELVEVLGVTGTPSRKTADALYDEIAARLAEPAFRPRALFERFGIEVLATTDSALSTLADHARIRADGWRGEVVPTFRPDSLLHPGRTGWPAEIAALAGLTGVDTGSYDGFLAALRARRRAFAEAGALATDHGHATAASERLPAAEAARIYAEALAGGADPAAAGAFAGHMLHVMAEMSRDDGLVMQIHPGVLRDHDPGVLAAYGPDRGFDIPAGAEFTRALRPLLASFGRDPGLRLIVYTTDETTYSRELAPLAGVYPALRLGAPWWFLDSPDGLRRYREAVTDSAGFYNTTGFVDDTRAFLSIPARHDLARRADAGHLARLVAEHRLTLAEAVETAVDLAYDLPRRAFGISSPGA
ncbi:uronate isomerase [Microtetraspora sp. NBRC 13810]|uniref:glucuronate isomerase n=1 Tax=Microtetraspora sp. NBRC 13810 TaxID=3030990 RepID=UPI0024A28EA3|nr:glucuronate isomerase [Microtetraspora sp. NBRC 13810]GLW10893.1 uronate isomerase [Microtetraspora sp. NBRC 13810]